MSVHRPPGPPQHPQTKQQRSYFSTKIDMYIYIYNLKNTKHVFFFVFMNQFMYLMMFLKWKFQFHASFVKKVQQQSELFYGTTRAKKKLQKESWIDKLMNQLSGSELSNKKKVPLPSAFKIFPQKFPTASNLHWTKKPRAPRSGCLDLRPFETSLGVQWPRQSAVALPPHPHGSAVRWLLKGSSEGRWVVEVSASDDDFVSCKMSLQNGVFFLGGGGGHGLKHWWYGLHIFLNHILLKDALYWSRTW